MNAWKCYGLILRTDFPFAGRMVRARPRGPAGRRDARGDPRTLEVTLAAPCAAPPPGPVSLLHASPYRMEDGRTAMEVYRAPAGLLLRFAGTGEFELRPGAIAIRPCAAGREALLQIRLLGPALSLYLESMGIAALHAAAVVAGGRAVVFLSGNRGGKSALAAEFVRAGHPLLTDDILPVEADARGVRAGPGYPQMRLWPEETRHFLDRCDELPRVHPQLDKRRVDIGGRGFGAFCSAPKRPACLYLPRRRREGERGGVEISPVPPAEAVMALVRHSFAARVVDGLGRQSTRLELFARLVERVPVRRLCYPHGLSLLPAVREAVRRDLATLP